VTVFAVINDVFAMLDILFGKRQQPLDRLLVITVLLGYRRRVCQMIVSTSDRDVYNHHSPLNLANMLLCNPALSLQLLSLASALLVHLLSALHLSIGGFDSRPSSQVMPRVLSDGVIGSRDTSLQNGVLSGPAARPPSVMN
jgi:hypothetical protein